MMTGKKMSHTLCTHNYWINKWHRNWGFSFVRVNIVQASVWALTERVYYSDDIVYICICLSIEAHTFIISNDRTGERKRTNERERRLSEKISKWIQYDELGENGDTHTNHSIDFFVFIHYIHHILIENETATKNEMIYERSIRNTKPPQITTQTRKIIEKQITKLNTEYTQHSSNSYATIHWRMYIFSIRLQHCNTYVWKSLTQTAPRIFCTHIHWIHK